ncbi:hypothetical protein Q9966_012248 [Columba livia]|nr:hypothetical protein Q9966_012248 [Columba livia]
MKVSLVTRQELLAVLRWEGPSTEGIFRRAASGTALWELREALDRGLDIDMGSQPADLLAVVLKVSTSDLQMEELLAGLVFSRAHLEPLSLQDFLRNIPSKLLMEDLYEEWMAAMERSSMEEKMEELKVWACGRAKWPCRQSRQGPSGSAQDKEIRRNCKRRHAGGDERDIDIEEKRRKRNNVFGDGKLRRCRKVQRFRKPSGGKKVVRVEEEEEDEDSDEDGSCLIFIWDRGSCVAHFGLIPRKGLHQPHLEMEENFVTWQELLAVLHQEGPSTEGIFRRAASGTALRELREALDRGLDTDMGSQPADLLAVVLKDFLRNIPSKLLMEDLYEEWMAAMERSSMEEKMEELKVWGCGRAKWPYRQSRQGPPGTFIFPSNHHWKCGRVPGAPGRAEEPFRG